jgi:YspA, cpYpsA-related SLOG family
MIVIIAGGRDYWEPLFAYRELDALHAKTPITRVIQGGATGADKLGKMWAQARNVPMIEVQADWTKYHDQAGPIRNGEMLTHNPDLLIVFPGNTGTRNMMTQAIGKGVPITKIGW